MIPRGLRAALLAAGLAGGALAGQPEAPARPRIGLVLSGGAAHGLAHVGVLKVLEELRVPVDVVTGTSMGAAVGGFYASGMPPAEMEALVTTLDWEDLFDDRPRRASLSYRRKQDDRLNYIDLELGISRRGLSFPSGLVAGQKMSFLLKSHTLGTVTAERFDDLPIPFRCVATDLATGEKVVLSSGSLGEALRASMSLPAVFSPVPLGGRLLVDGGLVDNLPVAEARALGAEVIVAVDVSSEEEVDREKLRSFGGVLGRVIAFPIKRNVAESAAAASVVVRPRVRDISGGSFARAADLVRRGEEAARAAAGALAELSIPEEEYRVWRERVRRARVEAPAVDAIQVVSRGVDPRQVRARLETAAGRPLEIASLRRDLDRIYEMGIFETVDFRLVRDEGRTVLVIDARPKSWGPTFFRLGSGFETNFQGDVALGLRATLHAMQLDALGGELRVTVEAGSVPGLRAELYQPLDFAGRFFAIADAGYLRSIARVAVPGGPTGEGRLRMLHGMAGAGTSLGSFGQIRAGVFRETGRGEPILTAEPFDPVDIDLAGYTLFAGLDTLDNLSFSRRGALLTANLDLLRPILGTDVKANRLQLRAVAAHPLGPETAVTLVGGWEDTLGSQPPFYLLFTLADFTRMAALSRENEAGERAVYTAALVTHRVGSLPTRLGRGVYVGAQLEMARAFERRSDARLGGLRPAGGVFAGADTILGPVYLGFGLNYGGANTLYLFLGRPF